MKVLVNGEVKDLLCFDPENNEEITAKILENEGGYYPLDEKSQGKIMCQEDFLYWQKVFADREQLLKAARDLPVYLVDWVNDSQWGEAEKIARLRWGVEVWEQLKTVRDIDHGSIPASDIQRDFAHKILDAQPVDSGDLPEIVSNVKDELCFQYGDSAVDTVAVECNVFPDLNTSVKEWCPSGVQEHVNDVTFRDLYIGIMVEKRNPSTILHLNNSVVIEEILNEMAIRADVFYDRIEMQCKTNEKHPYAGEKKNADDINLYKQQLLQGIQKVRMAMRETTGGDKTFNKLMKQVAKEVTTEKSLGR